MKLVKRNGQAMIIATLALGGAILGATTIAGLLMLYQIRGTTDSESSAKAIFAADSGVNWALFDFYCSQAVPTRCVGVPPGNYPTSSFANSVTVNVTCYDNANNATACNGTSTAVNAITRGVSLGSSRAFFVDLVNGAGSLP